MPEANGVSTDAKDAPAPKKRTGLSDDEDYSRRPLRAVPKPEPKRKPVRRGAK